MDYTQYGIKDALLVDNTGVWRDAEGLGQHLACPGIDRVVLTAPGKGKLKNIVHGINHGEITADDKIVSAASCTTNARCWPRPSASRHTPVLSTSSAS